MRVTRKDREVLRELAHRVAEIASAPEQADKARLWTQCNDLQPERPMVFADPQGGWANIDEAWLRCECDPSLRWIEGTLRRKLIRHEHIPDDYPILATLDVPVQVEGANYDDYGFALRTTSTAKPLGAYHIEPVITSERDFERLHFRPVTIDHEATNRAASLADDLVGDVLAVRRVGRTHWRYGLARVLIHMRGLEHMMLDMYAQPGLIHRLMGFLRDDFLHELDLFEGEDALGLNNGPDHVTGSGGLSPTRALPKPDYAGTARATDCICWAESQETVGVGPAQFEEFVLHYQLPLVRRFGLVDYGCCEPLDHKFDLLISRIPNLRWLAVPAWSNRALAAEKIGKRFVYVYKPNPAYVCAPSPAWDEAEREIRGTLEIARGCAIHIVMKDTHTFCHDPGRITRWAKMASRAAREMA